MLARTAEPFTVEDPDLVGVQTHTRGSPFSAKCQAPGLVEVRLDPFHRCDGRGGAVQEFVFNLDWWAVANLTVEPAMVEPVDIFGRRNLKVVDAPPGSFVADQFGFEQRVERLREDNRSMCMVWTW